MALTPQDVIDQADSAFNEGNLDAVLSFYEDNAVWVVKPGHIVSGKSALRREFEKIFHFNPKVTIKKTTSLNAGTLPSVVLPGAWLERPQMGHR